MILKYSDPKRVPYIEFEDGSNIGFPLFMEHPKLGFKWLVFSGRSTETLCASGKNTKKKKYIDITENISFTTDLTLPNADIDKRVKTKKGPLSPVVLSYLRKTFAELAPNGYLSRESLVKLESEINKTYDSEYDNMNEDPTITDDDGDDLDDE